MMKALVNINKLSKHYGKGGIKAVGDLDLTVYEEKPFGFLGPNRGGKTTTANLLNCIIRPTTLMAKDLIKRLVEKGGRTIFICSHIVSVVEGLRDRIGIINQGRLIVLGAVIDITSQTTTPLEALTFTDSIEEKELAGRGQKDVST